MPKRPSEPRRLRVYQQWQGNERFFCWGYCVTGPSWKSGMGSLALLLAPTVVFLVFVAPYMAARVNPVIMVVSCILPLVCASMLLLTSCRDPGVLPRQEPDEEWLQGRKPRARDVMVNGQRVTVRYNDTCHFYQPPRAHHCSVNDNCIERFDHHCPWVGTTIGKRNYRTFLLFIYTTSIYIAWTFGVSLGSLFVRHKELLAAAGPGAENSATSNLWLQTLGQSGAAIALMIFTFIFFWFVCGLSGFHTWLVATNQTTYENFRYNHNQVPNPYNEGFLRNCASVWCVPVPPSKVQFRAYLDEVQKCPVELGYPEWTGGFSQGPLRTAMDPNQQQQQVQGYSSPPPQPLADAQYEGLAAGGQNVQLSNNMAQARFAGLGNREAVLPVQGYDSITEGSSQSPISRSDARSAAMMAVDAAGQQSASSSWANPYYHGLQQQLQQHGLQQQQQQLPGQGALGAPGVQSIQEEAQQLQGIDAAGTMAVQQQRHSQGGHGPLAAAAGAGAVGNGGVSHDHVGIELPSINSNGNCSSSSGGGGGKQQHFYNDSSAAAAAAGLMSPRAAAAGAAGGSGGGRLSARGWSGAGDVSSIGAAASTNTEYLDARQSEGSWASKDDIEEVPNSS